MITVANAIRAVFAESVIRERRARHWSQVELALKAGISRSTVFNLEHQHQGVSLEVAAVIADAFGIPLAGLLGSGPEADRA